MSQYYPQQGPGYPPPPPPQLPQPPQQNPEGYYEEGDYEYEEVDETGFSMTQMALAFFGGGCLVFICVSICAFMLGVLWYIDPGAESGDAASVPGGDIGLSFTDPAYPNESVVNDQGVQLTILDVNRNASVETIPAVEGRETIIVTVELVNIGDNDAEFSERDFIILILIKFFKRRKFLLISRRLELKEIKLTIAVFIQAVKDHPLTGSIEPLHPVSLCKVCKHHFTILINV